MIAFTDAFLSGIGQIIGSIGVLSTGLAAVLSAIFSTRSAKHKAANECDARIVELRKAYKAGIRLADERPRRRKEDTA